MHKQQDVRPRQGQLRLLLELDARTHFDEPTRRNVVELLAQLLLSAAKTTEEERDEDRGTP